MNKNELALITEARDFAHAAHDSIGQKRKYTGEPYWVHTDEVASVVSLYTIDAEVIAAAHLHDVLEDVPTICAFSLEKKFGARVLSMVQDLTDVFTKGNYPHLNRRERKAKEAARLATIGHNSKTIKLSDFYSNTRDIVVNDEGFARTYLKEKEVILPGLIGGHAVLFDIVTDLLNEAKKTLGIK